MTFQREGLSGETSKKQKKKENLMEKRKEKTAENLTEVQAGENAEEAEKKIPESTKETEKKSPDNIKETERQIAGDTGKTEETDGTEETQAQPAETSGETEPPEKTQEQTPEEGKKPKKKGCLGCLGNIFIVAAVILLLMKGFEWLGRWQNPEENNNASLKARSYVILYEWCAGKFGEPFGEEGKITFGEYVLPVLDWFMLEDDKSTVGNDDINTLFTSQYTMDDEDMLAAYTGRKVKLTGKIVEKSDDIMSLSTDVNSDPLSEGLKTVSLNCEWLKDKPGINECVEAEGMLIVDPDFRIEGGDVSVSVIVREIREADYTALGGNPENRFMYQKTEPVTTVEQQGAKLEILGASVDAATGRAYVKYRLSIDEKEWGDKSFVVVPIGAKGSLGGDDDMPPVFSGETVEGGIVIQDETLQDYVEQLVPGDNQIVIIVQGYEFGEGDGQVKVDPDADIFLRADIPSESWTIVE